MQRAPLILTLLAAICAGPHAFAQQPEDSKAVPGNSEETPDETTPTEPAEGETGEAEGSTDEAGEDLQSLRAEYFKLRDRLFQSRARSSAVSSALYSTRVSIDLNYDSARYYTITRATIRLDGASVYDDSEGAIASDKATRFEGFIAPGRHQVSIRIEASGKDDDRFTSVSDNTFIVQAVKNKDLIIKASAADGGDIAYRWAKKESGSYRLRLDISVKSEKRSQKKTDHIKRTGELRKHGPAKSNRS